MTVLFKRKIPENDYSAAMLPSTRREVFFDVVKLQFPKLALCGLVSLIFTLPFLISELVQDIYQAALYQSGAESGGEAAALYLVTFQNVFAVLDVLLFVFLSVGLAGLSRIIKRLAWEEPVSIWPDFAKGVRQNGKHYALLGLLTGLVVFACRYGVQNHAEWFAALSVVLVGILLGPVAAYMTVTISVYDVPFLGHIKYALLLYGKSAPRTLLAAAGCFLIFIPQMLPNIYCHVIGRFISGLLIPFVMLAWFLFSFYRLDQVINPAHYPELVGRGLLGKQIRQDLPPED